jgi:hypothetical protein
MAKVVNRTKRSFVTKNKNGTTSTFTSYKVNGTTRWKKTGGVSTRLSRKK